MPTRAKTVKELPVNGHNVEVITYGDPDDPVDVALECDDCNEVLLDADLYTIAARRDRKHSGVSGH